MLLTHIRWISGWMMKRYVWFTPFAHIAHLDYLTTSKIRSDYDSNVDNLLLSPISFYLYTYPLENEPIKQWCHYFRHRSLKQIMLSTLNSDYRLNRTDDTLLLPPAWLGWADWFIRRKKCTYLYYYDACLVPALPGTLLSVIILCRLLEVCTLQLQIEDIHVNFQNDGGWSTTSEISEFQFCREDACSRNYKYRRSVPSRGAILIFAPNTYD